MITEERLKEYAKGRRDLSKKELREVCAENISLRSQKKALIEDGERLMTLIYADSFETKTKPSRAQKLVVAQHAALLKSLESEQPKEREC